MITCGFYNSQNRDRKYNTDQITMAISSLINDGVFQNIGSALAVSENTGLDIVVGDGYAWFNTRWTYNDTLYPITMDISEVLLDRIDAVILEIDESNSVRDNDIKFIKGTPAGVPIKPVMTNNEFVHQYPLAYIYRTAGNNNIVQANITPAIGTSECPFVTGVLASIDIDFLFTQWTSQFNIWFQAIQTDSEENQDALYAAFDAWFQNIKEQLGTVPIGNIQNEIDIINENLESKNLKTFTSVSQLGLIASTATLQQIIDEMPIGSEYWSTGTDLLAITFPTTIGKLIIRKWSVLSSEIEWHPASQSINGLAHYIMQTDADNGQLFGTWIRLITTNDIGLKVVISETAPLDTSVIWIN